MLYLRVEAAGIRGLLKLSEKQQNGVAVCSRRLDTGLGNKLRSRETDDLA